MKMVKKSIFSTIHGTNKINYSKCFSEILKNINSNLIYDYSQH